MTNRLTLCSLVLAAGVVPPLAAQTAGLRAGFQVTYTQPTGLVLGTGFAGSSVTPVPGAPNEYYVVDGAFGGATVQRVDLATPGAPVLVADGAEDLAGSDDILDSQFGAIGGLAALPTGELIIVENFATFTAGATLGDLVYIARDLNADGDFLDVVGAQPEVTPLLAEGTLDALTGQGDFTGATAALAPAGHPYAGDLFIVTTDGAGAGELLRIDDVSTAPTGSVFYSGLNFGAGISFDGDAVLVGESNFPAGGSLYRLKDGNSDGDANDPGEALVLYNQSLPGCSEIAVTNDGRVLVSANRPDFSGADWISASATVPEDPILPVYTPLDGISAGGLVALPSANPFGPNAGTGQQVVTVVGTNLAVIEPAPPVDLVPAIGYQSLALSPPDTSIAWQSTVSTEPTSGTIVYASAGSFANTQLWRLDVSNPEFPGYTLIADGADDFEGGDGVLDSGFGFIGDVVSLSPTQLVLLDNASPSSGGQGDLLFRLEDLNADGDFLDLGEVTPLVSEVVLDGLTGQDDFTGASLALGSDGAVYTITADGDDASEVLRIADPFGTPSASVFYTDGTNGGLDFGAGLAAIGDAIFAGDADSGFTSARLYRLEDVTADGDALDPGESNVVTSSLSGNTALASGPDDGLFRTFGFGPSTLTLIDTTTGADASTIATAPTAMGGIEFLTTTAAPFAPGNGNTDILAVQTSDFGFPVSTTFLHLLTVDEANTNVGDWLMLD